MLCFDARGAAEWVSLFAAAPQAAIGDEHFTSQGSQQPPGSPLSREEGEAPPPAPAPEGRRRSRRVRLRGSCRHRPSFLGRRELGTSAPAGTAPVSSEVSKIPNNGARGSEGLGEPALPAWNEAQGPGSCGLGLRGRPGLSGAGLPAGGLAAPVAHLWICAGGRRRVAFPRSSPEGRERSSVLERAWSLGGRGGPTKQNVRRLIRGIASLRGVPAKVRLCALISLPACKMGVTVF